MPKLPKMLLMILNLSMVLTTGCQKPKDGADGAQGPPGSPGGSTSTQSTAVQTIFQKWEGYVGGDMTVNQTAPTSFYANGITDFSLGTATFGFQALSNTVTGTTLCGIGNTPYTAHLDFGFEIEGQNDQGMISFYQNNFVTDVGSCNVKLGYQGPYNGEQTYTYSVKNDILTVCSPGPPQTCSDYPRAN